MKRNLLSLSIALPLLALLGPGVNAQTFTYTTIAGGSQGSNNGVGLAAQFFNPTGVAVDTNGNVYVADQENNAIREITPQGTNWNVKTIAGGTKGSADGTNTGAQFYGPTGIAVDSATNLYVSDQFNYTIRKLTPSGTNWIVTTIAGKVGVTNSGNGIGTNAGFFNPVGIAVDTNTNIFVADEFNNSIRELIPQGHNTYQVTTIAGGHQGSADGTNTSSEFYYPTGIGVDTNDRVFVADQFNNEIRLVTPTNGNWVTTTIAGQLINGASNGIGTNAQFYTPEGVAVYTNGDVFVSDFYSIRQLTPAGTNWDVTTVGGGNVGLSNGVGTNAEFHLPFGLAVDPFGDLFIADAENDAIREGVSSEAPAATGNLEVTITPGNAVIAGAEWQFDGGAFQDSGTTLTNLAPGSYMVTFSNITGYTTPAPQPIDITAHQTTVLTGNYPTAIPNAGSLEVLIYPQDAADDGGEWQVDNGPLQTNGAIVAGLSIGDHTVSFSGIAGWTTPAPETVSITNSETTLGIGTYVSEAVQLTNYTITVVASPTGEGTVTGGGTFQQNSIESLTATPTNGYEFVAWTGAATGTNNPLSIAVYTNLTVQANFAPVGSREVIVITNGAGSVTPNEAGKTFRANQLVSLHATPTRNTGYVFSNWTGSITTNKNPLSFKIQSTVVLQANFVPNPFPAVRGTYNGLFSTTNAVTEQTAGMLKNLTVNQNGNYSGTIFINGGAHGISGTFNLGGLATNKINRPTAQGGAVTVELALGVNGFPEQVTGTVSGVTNSVTWTAPLLADLGTNAPAGTTYTLLIPPDTNNAPPTSSPGGDGYASITTSGNASKIAGALADGTAFSEAVPYSATGYLPLYANLYGGKGLLLGWVSLNVTNTNGVSLTWIHPARPGLYDAGFTNILVGNQVQISSWTNPPANLDLLTNLVLLPAIGITNTNASYGVTISDVNPSTAQISDTASEIKGAINLKTGIFKVTIGTGGHATNAFGAILLNATNGGGYFLTKTNSQGLELQP